MEYYETKNGFAYGEVGQIPKGSVVTRKVDEHTIAIDHTFVDHSLRGQGIAKELVLLVVEQAKQQNLLIAPNCSYARFVLQGSEDLSALIAR